MRNIKIEDVRTIRCIETLDLNNYYLLKLYLKDVYFIFLNFVTHLTDEEEHTLLHSESERNAFLFNTEIKSYDSFLEEVRRLREGCGGLDPGGDAYRREGPNKKGVTQDAGTEGTLKGGKSNLVETIGARTNQPKKNYPRFDYVNELFYHLYTEDDIALLNIDKEVNLRVKKENIFEKCIRINNNIIIYMLSYLYFNDKLKRLRLDYNFHYILFNRSGGVKRGRATTSTGMVQVEKEDTLIEQNRLSQEHLFLIYLSHFKFYIVSFFLYSYVKFKGRKSATASRSTGGMTTRGGARSAPPPDKEQFLYNHEDNWKNVASVSSYISNFVNKVLHDIDVALKTNRSASNIDAESGKTKTGSCTSEMINEILKNKLSFKQVTLSHLDFCLSCMVLLNVYSPDGIQSCLHYGITYAHFCRTFKRYSASLALWRELQRANYFSFFEGIKQLSFIERCCLFPNVKRIRLDYLYSILFSANNRNKFALNISFIDQCIGMYNENRTSYMLECLGMHMKEGRVCFNMSTKGVDGRKPQDAPRCALLDNKQECVDFFMKTYQDRIDDYVYIFYDEKSFDRERCYRKFDVPSMVCFG